MAWYNRTEPEIMGDREERLPFANGTSINLAANHRRISHGYYFGAAHHHRFYTHGDASKPHVTVMTRTN